jgi:predicted RNase H-like HicB family nuclease
MRRRFTLEYWLDDSWYVGRLREVPGVFSQGKTLDELERNIQEAYELMLADQQSTVHADAITKEVEIEI